jgi:hypothetical protein
MSEIDRELESLIQEAEKEPLASIREKVERISQELEKSGDNTPKTGGNDIRIQISKMSMSEKIKTAMFGDEVARGLLIKDSNKLIQ